VSLEGNLVPEAFATGLRRWMAPQVYVIEYLPAIAPDRYRIRVLDMATGELSLPVNLRAKADPVDSEMAAVSRDQVMATGGDLLFTLYRGRHPGEARDYAFVHVLSTSTRGVWCQVLPHWLELDEHPGTVAVSADESTLYVASAVGAVAEFDIGAILDPDREPVAARVVRTLPTGEAEPALAVGPSGPVLAQGRAVVWLDDQLVVTAEVGASSPVEALATTPDGDAIVVGDGRVEVLSVDGSVASMALPAGLTTATKLWPG